jgi:hypothetical protein
MSELAPSQSDTIRQEQAREELLIKLTIRRLPHRKARRKEGVNDVDFLIKTTLDSAWI